MTKKDIQNEKEKKEDVKKHESNNKEKNIKEKKTSLEKIKKPWKNTSRTKKK